MLFEEKASDFVDDDCTLEYHESFLSAEFSEELFEHFKNKLTWHSESIFIYGKVVKQPRLTAWVGYGMTAESKYSKAMPANEWDDITLKLKHLVEDQTNSEFNSVLFNYYRDGKDSMGAHADDEPILGDKPTIASISLGEIRRFYVKRKTSKKTVWKEDLQNGSLLVMGGALQEKYIHGINKTTREIGPRINLTFRKLLV